LSTKQSRTHLTVEILAHNVQENIEQPEQHFAVLLDKHCVTAALQHTD